MKKILNIVLISLVLATFILPRTYSCAIEKSFFEISELEVSKDDKIEMIINLNKIKFKKFLFKLEASENIGNVEINGNEITDNIDKTVDVGIGVEKGENEITIEINKETNNLETLVLYYQIPQNLNVNDKIKFIATINNLDNIETEGDTQTVETEVKIVENTNKPASEESQNNKQNENNNPSINKKQNEDNKKNDNNEQNPNQVQNITNIKNSVSSIGNASTITEQTVTYNGSDNNYLSELLVDGYTLNKEFSKENSSYFITVEKDVNSLEIIAKAEDKASTVCIYGNEEISKSTSKILISVTAENGNVRNYRIYVTKNS